MLIKASFLLVVRDGPVFNFSSKVFQNRKKAEKLTKIID